MDRHWMSPDDYVQYPICHHSNEVATSNNCNEHHHQLDDNFGCHGKLFKYLNV